MQERIGQIGEYWLSKRPGSEQWCRTWFDAGTRQTKRASLGTGDLQEGKLRLWNWYAKYGRINKQEPRDTPLELVLVRHFEQHACKQKSADTARIALRYWSDFFPGYTVDELTIGEQERFVAHMEGRGFSSGYIKRILGIGGAALARAYKRGELVSAPYVLPGKDGPSNDRILSLEEAVAVWKAIQCDHEAMYLSLAFNTLARPEAILDLRREYANLETRVLEQNPPGRVQTKKFRPAVPITDDLLLTLRDAPVGPLVHWRGKPIASFKTAWRGLRRRAGLGKDVVPKVIRHTMATHLRTRAVPEADIQGMLGHRAYKGRTEVYAKYRPEYLQDARLAVDGYMATLRASCVLVLKAEPI